MSTSTLTRTIQEKRLANGIHALVQHIPTAPRLALNFYIAGGNVLEPKPGLMDLIDRLVMKGTTTRDQEQLSIDIDSLSLEMDTETRRDYSILSASLLPEDLEASLELIADVFYNSNLSEFESEKERLAGEIAMDLDAPRSRANDQLIRTIFPDSPYGVVGSVILENLESYDNAHEALRHYQQAYRPERVLMSLVGPCPDNWEELFTNYFLVPERPVASLTTAAGEVLNQLTIAKNDTIHYALQDSSQCHIYQAWLLPDAAHEDYIPLNVMNTILGGAGLTSRMFLELRDKQGLAYHVRSSVEAYRYRGLLSLYIGTEPKNREKCIAGFATEIQKLLDVPVPAWELDNAKANVVGRRALGMETAHQQANIIGQTVMMGRPLSYLDNYEQRILAVTSADVQRVAQTYFNQPLVNVNHWSVILA